MYSDTISAASHLNITLTRKSQLMDRTLPMQVVINGHKAGFLKNGQTETFHVAGESAELQAFLSMNKTVPVLVHCSGKEDKAYVIESTMTDALFVIGTILVAISTVLALFTEQWIYMLIAAPPALYHLYLRFVLKDKYLIIKEIQPENPAQLPMR